MKRLLTTTAALIAFAGFGSAGAADLPVKAPPMAPMMAPAYSWTGFYIGASLGGEWETIDGSFVFPPPATWSVGNSRGLWDAHAGAQYQWNMAVLGIEGNFVGLFNNGGGSDTCHPAASCAPGATMQANLVDNIWTVGGRLGAALNAWMPYLAGGYASTRVDNNFITAGGANTSQSTHNGWYLGVGVDWQAMVTPSGALVVGVEYRHYDFESATVVPTIVGTGAPNPFNTWTLKPQADTVELRLSWLFK